MASIIFYLQFAIISVPSVVSAQENTCKACNCQFSNVDIVSQLIDSKLAATGINELGKLAIAIYTNCRKVLLITLITIELCSFWSYLYKMGEGLLSD